MALVAGNNIQVAGYQLVQAVVENLSTAPTQQVKAGRLYWDTSAKGLRVYDDSVGAFNLKATDSALLQGNNAAYMLSRANQTGSQTASTISDLASVVQAYRLDQFAQPTVNIPMNGKTFTGLATPTANGQAATYDFVLNQISSAVSGIKAIKDPVRALFTTNQTLSTIPGTGAADGVSLNAGDPVLLIGQTTASQNGIWLVQTGGWTRPTSWSGTNVEAGTEVLVNEGSANAGSIYRVTTTGNITVDTTSVAFSQVNKINVYSAGNGLTLAGMVFSVQVVASGGILSTASGIQIDTSIVSRKFSGTYGDGSSMTLTVTHNLNTTDVIPVFKDTSGNVIMIEWVAANANAITVGPFGAAPASNSIRATVMG